MRNLWIKFLILLLAISFFPNAANAAKKSHKKPAKAAKAVASSPSPTPAPAVETVQRNHGIPREKLAAAYAYAKNLYAAKDFDRAKEIFKKIIIAATDPDLSQNSLYLFSQCAFRTEDFNGCVKSLTILAKRWPSSPLITSGYVSRFCYFVINEVANLQTRWDYYRFEERRDDKGQPVWKESVPPGLKIKRINFKLGFGLYRVLSLIQPKSPQTAYAKQKLDSMLAAPITMLWVDEKAPPTDYGHPEDFVSIFSTVEKKDFSKVICDRMFFDWETEKFYLLVDMFDDIRNLKPQFVARTWPPQEGVTVTVPTFDNKAPFFTLSALFKIAGYNPYSDSFTNLIESSPSDMSL